MSVTMPVLKIEIDRLREVTMHALADRSGEINAMLSRTIESTLTEEWVERKLHQSVKACIESAIDDVAKSPVLRHTLANVIEKMLAGEIAKNGDEK